MSRMRKGRLCGSPDWENRTGEIDGGEWPSSTGVVKADLEKNDDVRNGAGEVGLNERADPVDQRRSDGYP